MARWASPLFKLQAISQLSAVFVNAIRDQQAQIERQQVQIDALKGLVCQSHPDADVCR